MISERLHHRVVHSIEIKRRAVVPVPARGTQTQHNVPVAVLRLPRDKRLRLRNKIIHVVIPAECTDADDVDVIPVHIRGGCRDDRPRRDICLAPRLHAGEVISACGIAVIRLRAERQHTLYTVDGDVVHADAPACERGNTPAVLAGECDLHRLCPRGNHEIRRCDIRHYAAAS